MLRAILTFAESALDKMFRDSQLDTTQIPDPQNELEFDTDGQRLPVLELPEDRWTLALLL